jgi:hypothetical protein
VKVTASNMALTFKEFIRMEKDVNVFLSYKSNTASLKNKQSLQKIIIVVLSSVS